ncbi:replication protein P [Escherichia coli]|uniref:replication protein P n=5 Tax=Escherichia coli TaxID=562 RepID=UPI00041B4CC6
MNNVFTAIQNRDGEALSRMSGYEHQYTNNDNVVNMSAERLVDALFKQLKQLFPAAVVTNLKTPEQEVAAKQQWIAAFAEGGIRTREQVSAGMRHARASESPFWPSPGQFIKWCKDSKMVLGVTIDDVMAEFHRYSKEKSLYPGGPERFPWRHPVMYWVVCDTRRAMYQRQLSEIEVEKHARRLLDDWAKKVASGQQIPDPVISIQAKPEPMSTPPDTGRDVYHPPGRSFGCMPNAAIRRADSNYYRAVTAGKTGTLRPSHTEGTSWDGWGGSGDDDTGIEWEYLHSGFGIARITAANGTTATAEVISYIPSQVVGEDNASYKWAKYAWNSVNGYPGTVVYYQQRLYFAASTAFPQTIWASRTGDYKDFGKSNPTQDDDRIIYTYAGRQVNEIRHLIDVGSLVALTSGGEYVITGDQNKVLTPSSFAFSSQGSNGSSNVPPIAVANIALFVQEKGSVVRDLAYSFDVDGYQGNDLTILANHLFQKHSIVDWCFSIVPYSSAFCIRDDGKLLVMTYLRDQQVFAWAPQSSTGKYESTCSISEGNEDAVYFVVNRTVNGQTVRYIERLSSRLFTSDEDAFFVDSGLSYDGRNTSDRTMTITGGSGEWDYRAEYTISISGGAYFTSSDVGAQLQFPYAGTDPDTGDEVSKELRCDIISVTSNTAVVVRANRNVPPSLRNVATTNWQMARRTFGGLSHLEGQTVNILSDANVEPQKVVSGGAVTLESPGAVVHIGLPITAEFETLDININGQETLLDKKQVIPSVTLVVNASRGIWATTPGGKWYEYPQREFEFYDDPVDDATGKVEVKLDSNWGKNGRVRIRQLDPLPLSVLAVIPRLTVGGF